MFAFGLPGNGRKCAFSPCSSRSSWPVEIPSAQLAFHSVNPKYSKLGADDQESECSGERDAAIASQDIVRLTSS